MTKAIPAVQKFMTCDPVSVDEETLISEALSLMEEKGIRHLPIMCGEEVFGILSERDIKYALGLVDADPEKIKARDICHTYLYQASPDMPVDQVADEMAEKHYGCTVILQNNRLVGIFTTVDACRALSAIVRERFHS